MPKNIAIVILVVIILGLGGWAAYDNLSPSGTRSPDTSGTDQRGAGGKTLDYSNHGLTTVGSEIYRQTDATELTLSYNSLRSLPSELGKMDKLQVLRLDHNQLQGSLIAEIRKMPLVVLDASYNEMTGVPAEIGQLSKLETLDLSHNKITAFPNEIARITQLKTLNVTGNSLSTAQIDSLKSKLPDTEIVF